MVQPLPETQWCKVRILDSEVDAAPVKHFTPSRFARLTGLDPVTSAATEGNQTAVRYRYAAWFRYPAYQPADRVKSAQHVLKDHSEYRLKLRDAIRSCNSSKLGFLGVVSW